LASVLLTALVLAPLPARAQEQPDDLFDLSLEDLLEIEIVSVGVLGSHTHLKGEWMVGFKFMLMSMDGNFTGSDRTTTEAVLGSYMVSPLAMTMQMQMVDVMFAPSDALTLMVMIPYHRLSMDHRTRASMEFTAESSGVGDVGVQALFSVFGNISRSGFSSSPWGRHRILLRGGFTLPTGSINARDDLPAGPDQKLPYPMQVGSGTLSLVPGIVYLGQSGRWAWEVESSASVHLGSNDSGYALGDRLSTTLSGTREISNFASVSARGTMRNWRNITGADSDLNPMMVPTADPALRGGRRLDLGLGFSTYLPFGGLNKSLRVSFEAGLPIYQRLDGPQLGNDLHFMIGSSWTF
jgi:hypothetical protein